MYVTRTISECRKNPELLEAAPPEGPCSGVLVIQDEQEAEADAEVENLPVPQNKTITISYSSKTGPVLNRHLTTKHEKDKVIMLIPVPNYPLSSNTYYAIRAEGKHQGEAYTSSTEAAGMTDVNQVIEVLSSVGFKSVTTDFPSVQDTTSPLDPNDPLQQFQILPHPAAFSTYIDGFESKSVAPGAFPPFFLKRKGWTINAKTPNNFELDGAHGLDASLRARLPDFEFPIADRISAHVVVGKWYVPFMFVTEIGMSLKEQMNESMYYEMTLEQRWERIFESKNNVLEEKSDPVSFDICIFTTEVLIYIGRAYRKMQLCLGGVEIDGVMWYRTYMYKDVKGVGLSLGIDERMKWEQRRGGWNENGGKVTVERTEVFSGGRGWKKFACYVLVERFSLKRLDGTKVLNIDFYHAEHIKTKWEQC